MSVGFFHSEMLRVDYSQKGFLFTYNHFHPHFTFVFQPLLLDPALVFSLQYYIFHWFCGCVFGCLCDWTSQMTKWVYPGTWIVSVCLLSNLVTFSLNYLRRLSTVLVNSIAIVGVIVVDCRHISWSMRKSSCSRGWSRISMMTLTTLLVTHLSRPQTGESKEFLGQLSLLPSMGQ